MIYLLEIVSKRGDMSMLTLFIRTKSFFISTVRGAWSVNSNINTPIVPLQHYPYTRWHSNLNSRKYKFQSVIAAWVHG